MKPTNTKIAPCNPVSSNCVIWQGPDIPCIELCKGDTVSDVVANVATQLCNLLDELKISTFDLSCLGTPSCPPANFHDLIQLIIDKICEQNNITQTANGCPDCVVPIASCLQYFNPANGDLVTQGQLLDYVQLIATKLCEQITRINDINDELNSVASSARGSGGTTTITYDIPQVTPECVLPSVPTNINVVVAELERQFCNLRTATGNPTNIYSALTRECSDLANQPKLFGSGIMSSIPNWIINEQTLADNLNNLWLTVCDMRAAIINIQLNCCPDCCDGIDVLMTGELVSGPTLKLYFNGSVTSGFQECNGTTTLTISDTSGGVITVNIPVITLLNSVTGYSLSLSSTPINVADNLTITGIFCASPIDSTTGCSECQSVLSYTIVNNINCPTVSFSSTLTSISYSFIHSYGSATYVIELWNNALSLMVSSQTVPAPIPQTIAGTFSGLTVGTDYKVRVKVIVGTNTSTCPYTPVSTLPDPCPPPTNIYTEFNYVIIT